VSGSGAPAIAVKGAQGLSVAIIASRWHDQVMSGLIQGAKIACAEAGVEPVIMRVPGAFELPVVARAAAGQGFSALIALGVVIRGGTPHFEYVCEAATSGLARVALDTGIPVGFGLLTCDDEEQALDRAGLPGSKEDKGREAVEAALSTALLLQNLPTP
jgi:6,7-dimethyl-8-ribityllumazine synthase